MNALTQLIAEDPDMTADGARELAEGLLVDVGRRVEHSRGVADQVRRAERILTATWGSATATAAWLHDAGYAEEVAATGFHQLDGARWLAARGWPTEVCGLVAWHTGARSEARLRGQEDELIAEFEAPPAAAMAVLTWADLTTSPSGAPWTAERRLADILERHPPGSIVHRATLAARPMLLEAVRRVEGLLIDKEGPS